MALLDRLRRRGPVPDGDPPAHVADAALLSDLRAAVGAERVRVDGAERALLRRDASVFDGGAAGPIVLCDDAEQVRAAVLVANRHGRAVVPRGAGTGLAGGAVPLGAPVIISVARMNQVLSVDTDARIAWVEPGVVNLDLTTHLAPLGYHFAASGSSTAGAPT